MYKTLWCLQCLQNWSRKEAADSGFSEFRKYLSNAVQKGDVWRMKVEGARDTAGRIVDNLILRLHDEQAAIADDRVFYDDLLAKVNGRRKKAKALRRLAVDSLVHVIRSSGIAAGAGF